MEETLKGRSSIAATFVFIIVVVLQLLSRYVEQLKKTGLRSDKEIQLRGEIKQLLKEASSLSNPSTFAQAAKLKRMAAAKEKELVKSQELLTKVHKLSYETHSKALMILKVSTYLGLIYWFWRNPVAAISQSLLQPFGKVLSWKAGESSDGNVMVGIIPWLILSTRVSKYFCQKFLK